MQRKGEVNMNINRFINIVKGNSEKVIIITSYVLMVMLMYITKNELFMYISFAITIFILLKVSIKEKRLEAKTLILITLLYSLILPDNYVIILLSLILIIRYIKELSWYKIRCFMLKYKTILLLIMGFFAINILSNKISLIKVLIAVYFNFTFISYFYIFIWNKGMNFELKKVIPHLENIIIIQALATMINIIINFDFVKNDFAGDWSTGTLGLNQGNILCILLGFSSIYYFFTYMKSKEIKNLILFFISIFIMLSTFSLVNIVIFLGIIFIYLMQQLFKNKGSKWLITIPVVAIALLYGVSPQWVKNDIKNFTDVEYLSQRFGKAQTYMDTYFNIPSQDFKFLLIGNGVGNYSSRAALTVSGNYIGIYNKFLEPDVSEYSQKYIIDKLYGDKAQEELYFSASVLGTPLSIYITIMGEFGFIGLGVFIFIVIILFKEINRYQRYILSCFLLMCIFDNWIEFAKVSLIFSFIMALLYQFSQRNEDNCFAK